MPLHAPIDLRNMIEREWDAFMFRGEQNVASVCGWSVESRLPEHATFQPAIVLKQEELPAGLGDSLVGQPVCELVLAGEPATKDRPRATRNGGIYTPRQTRVAEEAARWEFRAAGVRADSDHWLRVEAEFRCQFSNRKDIDNLCKLLLDACNGYVWKDDMQVIELSAKLVRTSTNPGTSFRVVRLGRKTRDCERCGKLLSPQASRFCCRACYDAIQKLGFRAECPQCRKVIYRQRSEESKIKFCSQVCGYAYRRARRSPRDTHGFPTHVLVRERVVFVQTKPQYESPTENQTRVMTDLASAGAELYFWRPSDYDEAVQILTDRYHFRDGILRSVKFGSWTPNSLWTPEGCRHDELASL